MTHFFFRRTGYADAVPDSIPLERSASPMTDDLADHLAFYPDLGPDDRAALDARVAAEHPDGLPEHDEARRFAALFDRARSAQPDPRIDALFGNGEPVDDDDRAALEAVFPADPLARFRALDAKMQEVYPAPLFAAAPRRQRPAPSSPTASADRMPTPRAAMRRPVWSRAHTFAAVLVLLVGSVALWRGLQAPLGDFTAQELTLEGYGTVRGDTPAGATPEQRYTTALRELDESRTTTFGLFPRYDRERLLAARGGLDGVVRDSSSGDFLRLEALYLLGKTNLLLGDNDAATEALQQVVLGEGAKAREADALLRTMHAGEPG